MAKDFYAFRVNPESDIVITTMLENAENKTEFVKACIRIARFHMNKCAYDNLISDNDTIIRTLWKEV